MLELLPDKQWFVLRDLKRPNAKKHAYQLLQELPDTPLEVFTPMVSRIATRGGKRVVEQVPYLYDLLFVRETRSKLDPIIAMYDTLQYRYQRGGGQHDPMVVRDEEMQRFIAIVQGQFSYRYCTPEEVSPAMYGRQILIVGGALDGYQGRLMTTRGSRVKRLIVEIPNLLALTVEVNPEFIKLL